MKKFLFTVAALGSLTLPAGASIVTVADLGPDPTSATGAFSHSLGALTGAFADAYTFTLSRPESFTITSATNVFTRPSDFITGFTGGVFAGTPTTPGAEVLGPLAAGSCGIGCQLFSGSALLGSGAYFLEVTGLAGGTSGYGGNLTTSAVPLPGTLALFAGGLGLLGFWGRKRHVRSS